jgi:hypothetical protein
VFFACGALALAACGGGGGSAPGGGPPPTFTPTSTPTPSSSPSTTIAQGTLIDDPSETPLPGVTVQLDPWVAYPTPGPTPTPIAVSTTDAQGHFTISAPNGTYLLVIGPDTVNTPPPNWTTPAPSATDTPIPGASTWRATIHDRIVLTGGGTLSAPIPLRAPTMPPQPLYTPPNAETNGDYRLATLDSLTEAPCILAWNALRESNGLSPAVADEWSTENARAIAWAGTQPANAGLQMKFITSGNTFASGGANCANTLISFTWSMQSAQRWVLDKQTFWFGGSYLPYDTRHSAFGEVNFPIDPRVFLDPNAFIWL